MFIFVKITKIMKLEFVEEEMRVYFSEIRPGLAILCKNHQS